MRANKMLRKGVAVMLCIVISSFIIAIVPSTKIGAASVDDSILVCENNQLGLYVNPNTAVISVLDKHSNKLWNSNPETGDSDDARLNSQIVVSFFDELRNIVTVNSYEGSVSPKTFKIKTIVKNNETTGFRVIYNFENENHRFSIPIIVTLKSKYLEVTIDYKHIKEYGTSKVCQIDLMPLMGAGSPTDSGYLFLPDGSGGIVDFANITENNTDYDEPVYGYDGGIDVTLSQLPHREGIKMPVFGIKCGSDAIFGIITEQEALARIKASSAMNSFGYSAVYPSFSYRESDLTGIVDKGSVTRSVRLVDNTVSSENPKVCYYFLSGDEADYSGMARLYQSYLVKKFELTKNASKIFPYIEAFGLTYKKTNFFGLSFKSSIAANKFSDLLKIESNLKDLGINNTVYSLIGFSKNGYHGNSEAGYSISKKLGGQKGLDELIKKVGEKRIFYSVDLVRNYSNAGKLFKGSDYISGLNNLTVVRQSGKLSTGAWNDSTKWLFRKSSSIISLNNKLTEKMQEATKIGVLYENLGSDIYSDFSDKINSDRQQLVNTYQSCVFRSQKQRQVAVDGGNIYALFNSTMLCEIPDSSSNQNIISYSVPFYTMVLHGYVTMCSKPINEEYSVEQLIRFCGENGVCPTFRITSCDNNKLKNSELSFLYNSKYEMWEDTIKKSMKCLYEVQNGLENVSILKHQYVGALSIMYYENGTVIVSNTGNETEKYEDMSVGPYDIVRID